MKMERWNSMSTHWKWGNKRIQFFPSTVVCRFSGPEILFFFCEIEGIFRRKHHSLVNWWCSENPSTNVCWNILPWIAHTHWVPMHDSVTFTVPKDGHPHLPRNQVTSLGTCSWSVYFRILQLFFCCCFFVHILFFHPRYSMSCVAYSYTSIWVV